MEKNQNVFLGMQLKALREKNGYTMEKMAQKLAVNHH